MISRIRFLGLALSILFPAIAAQAQNHPHSRTYFNQDIFIAQGQQIQNATCMFCSVQVEGDVTGSVFVLFGNLNVSGRVRGRATVIGGNAVIDSLAQIGGNALVVGGNAVYEAEESIAGNAWVIGGHLSPLSRRARPHHRFSFSPILFSTTVVVIFLLAAVLFLPRSRPNPVS
jgi:carbonic anhydrase/acetyltransferase-like protein (isoleucine patch superfamily)